jgi:DNA repair protein RecO (recombination protein O)
MSTEKSLAIVLRLVDFSESSCVVTLFTEEFGKITGLAKGARRPKSPFEAALDLLAIIRVVFIHKSSEALDLLTEARLERRFRAASRDLSRLYAGYYVAELLNELTDESDPHPDLFHSAVDTLQSLDDHADVMREVLRFELTALRALGHLPSLRNCVQCGEPVAKSGRIAFGQLVGGVLCERCKTGKKQVVLVSVGVIEVLRTMASEDRDDWKSVALPSTVLGELRAVLNHYISHLVGHRLKLQQYFTGDQLRVS